MKHMEKLKQAMAGLAPDALLAGGAGAVSFGVGRIHEPSGVIVAGLFLLAAGWAMARGGR